MCGHWMTVGVCYCSVCVNESCVYWAQVALCILGCGGSRGIGKSVQCAILSQVREHAFVFQDVMVSVGMESVHCTVLSQVREHALLFRS